MIPHVWLIRAGIALAAVAAVGIAVWVWGNSRERDGYDKAVAENNAALVDAQRQAVKWESKVREVQDDAKRSHAEELANLAAEYAARPAGVIRVCVNTSSSAGAVPESAATAGRADAGATGARPLQAEIGRDSGAVLDPAPIYALMQQCDALAAQHRALQSAVRAMF